MKMTVLVPVGVILLSFPLAGTAQQFGDFNYASTGAGITITGYTGPGGAVTIPPTINGVPVTSIGTNAFRSKSLVTSVTIPDGVFSVAQGAFKFCDGLASAFIPGSVTNIGSSAFEYCTSLTNVEILDGVSSIGDNAFANSGLLRVAIPGSVSIIGEYAFDNCRRLTGGTILSGSIGDAAFAFCASLTNVTILNGVTSIGYNAFINCDLAGVTIPSSVTNVGDFPFGFNPRLTAMAVDPASAYYNSQDGVLFNKGKTTLIEYPAGKAGNYLIPSSVTSIANKAFYYCTSLAGVSIPNCAASIGDFAFYRCTNLTNVTIPGSVSNIGDCAFFNCARLASVTILSGKIGYQAFAQCFSLTNVTMGNGVTAVGDVAFVYCRLGSVTIPGTVTNVGRNAFGCSPTLTAFNVDPANAYYSSLDGVLFDRGQTTLIEYPGGKVGNYLIPGTVTSVGPLAFYDTSLRSVTVPSSVTNIGDVAFGYLQTVFFTGSAPSFGWEVFGLYPSATVYYLPGTSGWSATFAGVPTRLWNPLMQSSGPSFGVGPAGFGFNITGTTNIPIVIEACTNLGNATWVPLKSLNLNNGMFYFSDPNWADYPARFYRIRSP